MSESKNGYTSKLLIGALVYALGVLAFNVSNFWWGFYLGTIASVVTLEVAYQQLKCMFTKNGNIPHCSLLILSAWVGVLVAHELGTSRRGTAIFAIIFSMVVAFDTFSQVGGVIWSKFGTTHKIAPNESKNKTKEGSFVGYVASIITGSLMVYLLDARLALHGRDAVVMLVIIGFTPVVAYFGDINESMAKRRLYKWEDGELVPLKDFSKILYTVGGVCERYDGQLAATSIMGSFAWVVLL